MSEQERSSSLLSVVDIEKHFKHWRRGLHVTTRAVDGVSIDVKAGEILGIAGESGCGKSTLARLISGLVPPTAGEVQWHGKNIWDLDRQRWQEYRRSVQMVFQDPDASLNPRKKISDIVASPLQAFKVGSKRERQERVLSLLSRVQLSPPDYYSGKYPHELSGGAKQRVGIARALALEPSLLIADEPIASLDVSIRGQILKLLRDLNAEFGLTVLLVSHDLNVLRAVSTRIGIMYLGKMVEEGPTRSVFSEPRHRYTSALLALASSADPHHARTREKIPLEGEVPSASSPPSGCRFHTRCRHRVEECIPIVPAMEELSPDHWAACHNPVPNELDPGKGELVRQQEERTP